MGKEVASRPGGLEGSRGRPGGEASRVRPGGAGLVVVRETASLRVLWCLVSSVRNSTGTYLPKICIHGACIVDRYISESTGNLIN